MPRDDICHQFLLLSLHIMVTGTIKKKMEKGFGFISPSEGGDDVFFHMSACGGNWDSLSEGQAVSFEIEDSPKGKRAINVVAA
jgi:CspA family cold shock protein